MSNLLAAIGRGQLQVLDNRVSTRGEIFDRYVEMLSCLSGTEFMPEPKGFHSSRWLTSILVDEHQFGALREVIRSALEAENIMLDRFGSRCIRNRCFLRVGSS